MLGAAWREHQGLGWPGCGHRKVRPLKAGAIDTDADPGAGHACEPRAYGSVGPATLLPVPAGQALPMTAAPRPARAIPRCRRRSWWTRCRVLPSRSAGSPARPGRLADPPWPRPPTAAGPGPTRRPPTGPALRGGRSPSTARPRRPAGWSGRRDRAARSRRSPATTRARRSCSSRATMASPGRRTRGSPTTAGSTRSPAPARRTAGRAARARLTRWPGPATEATPGRW